MSPFTVARPVIDGSYTFRVRARDAAGNVDATPATYAWEAVTPLTEDLATAEAAAALYFPNTRDMDVLASCPSLDCPDGVNPAAPANQLRVTSARAVQPVVGAHRYDVTVTQSVTTLQTFAMRQAGVNCNVTLNSANGLSPTWTFTVQLNFAFGAFTGDKYIYPANVNVSGMEDADYSLSGDFLCTISGAFFPRSLIESQYEQFFADYSDLRRPWTGLHRPVLPGPNHGRGTTP